LSAIVSVGFFDLFIVFLLFPHLYFLDRAFAWPKEEDWV